ncbi:unnamed protein product [Leptidea sinapis]|nr:unnamed protein product [Leptidea sinapis]
MALTTKFLLLVISLLCSVDAYKILVVISLPGRSHGILGEGLVRHLTNAGHENMMSKRADINSMYVMIDLCLEVLRSTVANHNVQNMLRDPTQKFDVVISEWLYAELYAGYMSFWEDNYYKKYLVPYIKNKPVPTFEELKYNASLMLGNSHISLGEAYSLPQSYKPIGGYHIETDVRPLPKDLKVIMDNSLHGVIYFSMGSNLRSEHFPEKLIRRFLDIFAELKQTVIWKFEANLSDIPKNPILTACSLFRTVAFCLRRNQSTSEFL